VKSPRARNKIKHYFSRERREESIENGKDILARQMRKAGLPLQRLLTLQHLTAVAGFFKQPDVSACTRRWGRSGSAPRRSSTG
jgi:GTP pyrophosphokinase